MEPLMTPCGQQIKRVINEITACLAHLDHNAVTRLVETLDTAPVIFIAGTGRTGLVMRCFAMRLMQLGCAVHVVGDVTTPAIQPDDLLLIGSGSGKTGSLLANADQAQMVGATVALITTSPSSPLAGMARMVVSIGACSPKTSNPHPATSVQPMATLFEQSLLVFLDSVVMILMRKKECDAATMFARHANLE